MASSNLSFLQAEAEINSREVMPTREPSLKPTEEALKQLGLKNNIDPKKVIIVAGTNGKGSTAKTLEVLLRNAGFKTGFYSSPHLVSIRERIQINGENISEEEFAKTYEELKSAVDLASLSHFEILTLMAALRFHSEFDPVEYAIYEVGMGGTWDATNAIPHENCVIAKIGKDHEQLLGPGLESIARNKFGIVSEGSLVVHLPLQEELLALKEEVAMSTRSNWKEAVVLKGNVNSRDLTTTIEFQGVEQRLSLNGTTAIENTSLALSVFSELGFDPANHLTCLNNVYWPGRLHRFDNPFGDCDIIFSGDHNLQGIESLLMNLKPMKYENFHFLVSVGNRKSVDEILSAIYSFRSSKLYLTTANFMGRKEEEYGDWTSKSLKYQRDGAKLFEELATTVPKNDLLVVTGSLYLVGDILGSVN